MTIMDRAVEEFIQRIKETQEYRDYQIQKVNIEQIPELKQQVDEFRERNFEIQSESDGDILFDEIDQFESEFEGLLKDTKVNDFLESELAYCRMIQDFTAKITAGLDFD